VSRFLFTFNYVIILSYRFLASPRGYCSFIKIHTALTAPGSLKPVAKVNLLISKIIPHVYVNIQGDLYAAIMGDSAYLQGCCFYAGNPTKNFTWPTSLLN
jgi:hypothetical protein